MFRESANTRDDDVINSIAQTPAQRFDASVPWLETQAEVTACRYEFAKMNTLSLGIAPSTNQFMVSFSYYAHAKTFCDEFTSSGLSSSRSCNRYDGRLPIGGSSGEDRLE